MKKRKGIRILVLIIGLIVSLGIPLITASINLIIDPQAIYTAAFWLRWGVVQLGVMSAYLLTTNFRHECNLDLPEYTDKEDTIKQLVSTVNTDLGDFLQEYNRENKKKSYVNLQTNKIINKKEQLTKLKMCSKITDRKQRKINKIEIEIRLLEEHITPKYVEKNIDYIKVKYPHISKAQLYSDNITSENDTLIQSSAGFYSRKSTGRFMRSALITAVFASIGVTGFLTAGPNLLYNIVTTIFNIMLAAYSGFKTADICFKQIISLNQLNRITVLKQYSKWCKKEVASNE